MWLRNSKGDLPLHEAVASGRRELVKWLLDGRPSQVNATNHEGRTPLHIAAATDNADLCRLLFDRGAEVNPVARSSKNEPLTPLDCATTRGHRSTAKYLQMHGGIPASKLANTEIVIDGASITALPTRRVTSTKIDVRDRIRIEKREVVELSSPLAERRHIKDRSDSESTDDSSSLDRNKSKRRSEHKYSDRHHGRRKKLLESQKSFSDGYDSEIDRHNKDARSPRHKRSSKKNRSKSEPSRIHDSAKHHRRYRSGTESSSESESCSEKKKHKRHRKRSKRKTSSPSESSSSESSERRSTKRKGKKTSIHIENDDEKQSVNIVKYKNTSAEKTDNTPIPAETPVVDEKSDVIKDDSQIVKSKTQSETETDTVSVKTNMVVTEAQIHMERESSQHGSSEITVTVDSSNNVSIETSNLSVTHKDLDEEKKLSEEKISSVEKQSSEEKAEPVTGENAEVSSDPALPGAETKSPTAEEDSKKDETTAVASEIIGGKEETTITPSQSKDLESSKADENLQGSQDSNKHTEASSLTGGDGKTSETVTTSSLEKMRKRSFQVLSGPDEAMMQSKDMSGEFKTSLDAPSIEQTESQEKSSSPIVSFANKDEIFESKDSDKQSDHLMGEHVDHYDIPVGSETLVRDDTNKDSSESNILSSEEKRKEYASTTGSSTEISHTADKGLVTVIDDEKITTMERAVQQVMMGKVSEEYDIKLPLSESPKRTRKSSRDSQVSSRKSSIYETESYKVLSDVASAPEVTTSILKKPSKVEDGSIEDDKDTFERELTKDGSFGRIPSVSDNELYGNSEVNGRRKRFRKKGRTKSRTTIRSKSENSERGYESSGLMDSGFEPSPRALQRRIMSPRLAAYYQQRNASGRYSGKSDSRIPVRKPGDKRAVDMKSVTQRIQTNMRR